MIASSFGIAWAARRYRSMWLGMIVHGVEGLFVVLVLAMILGWYL
jgi:membrane protease YdiL (CAAX protease family)